MPYKQLLIKIEKEQELNRQLEEEKAKREEEARYRMQQLQRNPRLR